MKFTSFDDPMERELERECAESMGKRDSGRSSASNGELGKQLMPCCNPIMLGNCSELSSYESMHVIWYILS